MSRTDGEANVPVFVDPEEEVPTIPQPVFAAPRKPPVAAVLIADYFRGADLFLIAATEGEEPGTPFPVPREARP